MKFNLNNLETLEDYTNASKHFILLYDPRLIFNEEIIGIVVISIHKTEQALNKTKSINRYNYTKRGAFNTITNYLRRIPKIITVDNYVTYETPLDHLILKEKQHELNTFINTLPGRQKQCAELLCAGYNMTDISKKMKVSRQAIDQLINRIKTKYVENYVQKEKK